MEIRTSYVEGTRDSYGKDFAIASYAFLAVLAAGLGIAAVIVSIAMFSMI